MNEQVSVADTYPGVPQIARCDGPDEHRATWVDHLLVKRATHKAISTTTRNAKLEKRCLQINMHILKNIDFFLNTHQIY